MLAAGLVSKAVQDLVQRIADEKGEPFIAVISGAGVAGEKRSVIPFMVCCSFSGLGSGAFRLPAETTRLLRPLASRSSETMASIFQGDVSASGRSARLMRAGEGCWPVSLVPRLDPPLTDKMKAVVKTAGNQYVRAA